MGLFFGVEIKNVMTYFQISKISQQLKQRSRQEKLTYKLVVRVLIIFG